MAAIGIDFGTTNSVVARADAGVSRVAICGPESRRSEAFRSVLYFAPKSGIERSGLVSAGPYAVEASERSDEEGRLVQSIKSHLGSAGFEGTSIHGRRFTLPSLIGTLLQALRNDAERDLGPLGPCAVVGRPVRFAGTEPDDALAEQRLREAFATAGFTTIRFVEEPVAAAHAYAQRVSGQERLLVADFGGGTSDFSILTVENSSREAAIPRVQVVATSGVDSAGDAFDRRIIEHVVSPVLGSRGSTRVMGKQLPMPAWLYRQFEQWHYMSLLRTPETMRLIDRLIREADAPERVEGLRYIIENNLGFALYRSVSSAKEALSHGESTELNFRDGPVKISRTVLRSDFERWIAPELSAIGQAIDRVLDAAGNVPADITRVFMTGGSSLVPAVRALFAGRFGAEKLAHGGELLSVASGLALVAETHEREGTL